jgi:hypothetical protein
MKKNVPGNGLFIQNLLQKCFACIVTYLADIRYQVYQMKVTMIRPIFH